MGIGKARMLEEMRSLLLDRGIDGTAREAFSNMFGSAERFDGLLAEMRKAAGNWEPPRHLRRPSVVFAVVVEAFGGDVSRRMPLTDIMKMKVDDIPSIPEYISAHPYADDAGQAVSNGWDLTLPLILTTTDELLSMWAYSVEEDSSMRATMLAAILYEMSLLGETVAESDARKESLHAEMERSLPEGVDMDVEDLLAEASREQAPDPDPGKDPVLELLEVSRYNARLGMYERLHFDLAQEEL